MVDYRRVTGSTQSLSELQRDWVAEEEERKRKRKEEEARQQQTKRKETTPSFRNGLREIPRALKAGWEDTKYKFSREGRADARDGKIDNSPMDKYLKELEQKYGTKQPEKQYVEDWKPGLARTVARGAETASLNLLPGAFTNNFAPTIERKVKRGGPAGTGEKVADVLGTVASEVPKWLVAGQVGGAVSRTAQAAPVIGQAAKSTSQLAKAWAAIAPTAANLAAQGAVRTALSDDPSIKTFARDTLTAGGATVGSGLGSAIARDVFPYAHSAVHAGLQAAGAGLGGAAGAAPFVEGETTGDKVKNLAQTAATLALMDVVFSLGPNYTKYQEQNELHRDMNTALKQFGINKSIGKMSPKEFNQAQEAIGETFRAKVKELHPDVNRSISQEEAALALNQLKASRAMAQEYINGKTESSPFAATAFERLNKVFGDAAHQILLRFRGGQVQGAEAEPTTTALAPRLQAPPSPQPPTALVTQQAAETLRQQSEPGLTAKRAVVVREAKDELAQNLNELYAQRRQMELSGQTGTDDYEILDSTIKGHEQLLGNGQQPQQAPAPLSPHPVQREQSPPRAQPIQMTDQVISKEEKAARRIELNSLEKQIRQLERQKLQNTDLYRNSVERREQLFLGAEEVPEPISQPASKVEQSIPQSTEVKQADPVSEKVPTPPAEQEASPQQIPRKTAPRFAQGDVVTVPQTRKFRGSEGTVEAVTRGRVREVDFNGTKRIVPEDNLRTAEGKRVGPNILSDGSPLVRDVATGELGRLGVPSTANLYQVKDGRGKIHLITEDDLLPSSGKGARPISNKPRPRGEALATLDLYAAKVKQGIEGGPEQNIPLVKGGEVVPETKGPTPAQLSKEPILNAITPVRELMANAKGKPFHKDRFDIEAFIGKELLKFPDSEMKRLLGDMAKEGINTKKEVISYLRQNGKQYPFFDSGRNEWAARQEAARAKLAQEAELARVKQAQEVELARQQATEEQARLAQERAAEAQRKAEERKFWKEDAEVATRRVVTVPKDIGSGPPVPPAETPARPSSPQQEKVRQDVKKEPPRQEFNSPPKAELAAEEALSSNVTLTAREKIEGKVLEKRWEKFREAHIDSLYPLEKTVKMLVGKEDVSVDVDAAKVARLARASGGLAERIAERDLILPEVVSTEKGVPVYKKAEGTSFKKALKPLLNKKNATEELQKFDQWLVALRAVELDGQGVHTGLNIDQQKTIIKKFDSPEFRGILKDIAKIDDVLFEWEIAKGLTTRQQAQAMKEKNPYGIPFNRKQSASVKANRGGNTGSFIDIGRIHYNIEGGNGPVVSPLATIYKRIYQRIDAASKMEVAQTLVRAYDAASSEVKDEMKGIITEIVRAPNIKKGYNTLGLSPEDAANGIIAVRGNGENIRYFKLDPELYRAMDGVDPAAMNAAMKIATQFASVFREGATGSGNFVLRALTKDVLDRGQYGGGGFFESIKGLPKAMKDVLLRSDAYWDAKASGAFMNYTSGRPSSSDYKNYNQLLKDLKPNDEIIAPTLKGIQRLFEAFDDFNRMAEYNYTVKHGSSAGEKGTALIRRAAYEGRQVTLDFMTSGRVTKEHKINSWIPFHNPAIQGNDRTYRSAKKDPMRFALRGIPWTLISLATIAQRATDKDAQARYDEEPSWRKAHFWLFMKKNGGFVYIPKPPAVGFLFGSTVEMAYDYLQKKDPKGATAMVKEFASDLTPNMVPPIMLIPLEQAANKRYFSGQEIVPKREQGWEPREQYDSRTSTVAKGVGKALNVSPRRIDAAINQTLGGFGSNAMRAVDYGVGKVTGDEKVLLAEIMPGSHAFTGYKNIGSSSVNEFYDQWNNLERKRLANKRNPDAPLLTEDEYWQWRRLKDYKKYLDEMNKEIRDVKEQKLSPKAKKKLVDELELRRVNFVREALGKKQIKSR